ncbi:MAG TPA: response regulator, partial [Nitrospirae bacterium]|nr:response regulator [Nitrospirota bacterium]
LQRMGFDVIAADDGKDVLKLIKIAMPDLVMLDIALPVVDGVKVLSLIKSDEQLSKIPVIMVTVEFDDTVDEKCVGLGCSGYLFKPVRINKLRETIEGNLVFGRDKRRKHLRSLLHKRVALTHNGKVQECYAVSLSTGGIYIRQKEPLPTGSKVDISIDINDENTLNLKGTVIYQKGLYGDVIKIAPGMGIEFIDVNPNESSLLKTYITKLLAGDILSEQDETVITE